MYTNCMTSYNKGRHFAQGCSIFQLLDYEISYKYLWVEYDVSEKIYASFNFDANLLGLNMCLINWISPYWLYIYICYFFSE